jgi:excisionase family DNA binding protein
MDSTETLMAKQKPDSNDDSDSRPAPSPANDLMTTKELMDYLQISRTKVWELVHKKGLPAFRIGGDYRYRRSEVDKWIEGQRFVPEGGGET